MSVPSATQTEDRRVLRTRAALRRAIVDLSLDKGFQSVTGDDIARSADVTRASFYKHYVNKEHLLADAIDSFADEVMQVFHEGDVVQQQGSRVATLIHQSRRHRDLVRLVVSGEGDGIALRRLTEVIENHIVDDIESGRLRVVDPDVNTQLMVKLRAAQVVAGVTHALDVHEDGDQLAAQIVSIIDHGWHREAPSHDSKEHQP